LDLSRVCTSCHKDRHDGRFGTGCQGCHDETAWSSLHLQSFDHDQARYALRGAHATVPCAKCHFDPPKYTGLKFALCGDCHRDPHAGRLGTSCTDCHGDLRWKPVSFAHTGAKHPGVSLGGGHASLPCQACHDRGNLSSPSKGTECVSCHKPVHEAPLGRACASCHGAIQWLGLARSVGLAVHPRTVYPLTGRHLDVACAGCHRPELAPDRRYRRLAFDRCADCHQDRHGGEFQSADHGECKLCHATAGFRPTLFGVDLHAATAFPLVGKHLAAPCSACHKASRPRLNLHVPKQACSDCHANPHGDQFAKEMAQGGCAHCHDPRGWDLPKFDHSTWPLTGAHATAQCDSCHHPTPEDRKAGHGASYRGVARNCSGCHDDVHLGQFRLTRPALECNRCHATTQFKIPDFDHKAVTGWELTGAHEKTPCAKCHPATTMAGERQVVRWRGPSTECAFCHANPHERRTAVAAQSVGATARQPGASVGGHGFSDAVPCSACHSTRAWRSTEAAGSTSTFDHSTTGFPLTGAHTHAPCVACHNSTRPIKRDCASCHEDFHRGRLSQSCDQCHSSAGWRVTQPLEVHRRTRFPLTGMHVLADCSQCHLRASEQKFTDAPVDCYGCHEQDYRRSGIFPVHVGTAGSPPLPRDCSLCHRALAWVPANTSRSLVATTMSALRTQIAPPNHDARFPIGFGSHRTATCSDCHASPAVPRDVRCIGCHAHDPVLLAQQHGGTVATSGGACLGCHPAGVRR
ncbi:MAG TPA: cytochrome c3 family protein, partial [Polyangiaceae bacterium]|nr:cytochrome c3 family protein [Polyangiaceae bacterium]